MAARLQGSTSAIASEGGGRDGGSDGDGGEGSDGRRRGGEFLPIPVYRQAAESLFEIQARSRRGEA